MKRMPYKITVILAPHRSGLTWDLVSRYDEPEANELMRLNFLCIRK